jgi:ribosome recycling factor
LGSSRPNHVPQHPTIRRPFSHTTCRERRNGNENTPPAAPATTDEGEPKPEPIINPYDFTDLHDAYSALEKRFVDELKQLRSGGKGFAEAIGAVPVRVDKKSPQVFPLRELATVAPLGGRRWSILAFEESSVKPIMSAVQRSDHFNQQPQRSEDNPLELVMTVEPERVDALSRRAMDICNAWRNRVREETHNRGEKTKKYCRQRRITSDDLHRLKEKAKKFQDEQMKIIQAKEKEVVQLIMARSS